MKRLAQLSLSSKNRGMIVWTFWENNTNPHRSVYFASSIDAYGNTNMFEYNNIDEMRQGYQTLRAEYNYQPVAA